MKARLTLVNQTRYSTRDLRRFFLRGLDAMTHGHRTDKHIVVVYSRRGRVWGCAGVSDRLQPSQGMRFALPVRNLDLDSFGRVLRHENAHNLGLLHGEMDWDLRYCMGPDPEWVAGLTISLKPERVPKPKPTMVDVQGQRHARVVERIGKWTRRLKSIQSRLRTLHRQDAYYRRALAARPAIQCDESPVPVPEPDPIPGTPVDSPPR